MLTVSLSPDFRLDEEATREAMKAAGFELRKYDENNHFVKVQLTPQGDAMYKTNDEAISALCDCFVEKV